MKIAKIKELDISSGDGIRVSVFVSGCRHYCKACFNKDIWSFKVGDDYSNNHFKKLVDLLSKDYISGLTLLGGEPLDPLNIDDIFNMVSNLKKVLPNLNIWVYSGYTYEYLTNNMVNIKPIILDLLNLCDILVDGKFEIDKFDLKLKFRGSSNQRIIDLKNSTKDNIKCLDL